MKTIKRRGTNYLRTHCNTDRILLKKIKSKFQYFCLSRSYDYTWIITGWMESCLSRGITTKLPRWICACVTSNAISITGWMKSFFSRGISTPLHIALQLPHNALQCSCRKSMSLSTNRIGGITRGANIFISFIKCTTIFFDQSQVLNQ